jgi:hypothetical protein
MREDRIKAQQQQQQPRQAGQMPAKQVQPWQAGHVQPGQVQMGQVQSWQAGQVQPWQAGQVQAGQVQMGQAGQVQPWQAGQMQPPPHAHVGLMMNYQCSQEAAFFHEEALQERLIMVDRQRMEERQLMDMQRLQAEKRHREALMRDKQWSDTELFLLKSSFGYHHR